MKSWCLYILTLLVLSLTFVHVEHSVVSAQNNQDSIRRLLGDKDGFGLGLEEGDILGGFFDNRDLEDPFFTDVQPIPTVGDFPSVSFSYFHRHLPHSSPPGSTAALEMLTLGIQDGDTQVVGSNTEIKLFLDEEEVEGAFDDIDQFDFFPGVGFASVAGLVRIEIPRQLFELFSDGEVEVKIEIHQLGTAPSIDAFAIDYSELVITPSP